MVLCRMVPAQKWRWKEKSDILNCGDLMFKHTPVSFPSLEWYYNKMSHEGALANQRELIPLKMGRRGICVNDRFHLLGVMEPSSLGGSTELSTMHSCPLVLSARTCVCVCVLHT